MTVSDRSARGERPDRTGPRLIDAVQAHGDAVVVHHEVVADDERALSALLGALADGGVVDPAPDVVLAAGGTGVAPRDRTPEALVAAAERLLPGIGEAIRADGRRRMPTAVLSRALAGVRGGTLVVALPGSPGGAVDGWGVVGPLAQHVCDQLRGGDHPA